MLTCSFMAARVTVDNAFEYFQVTNVKIDEIAAKILSHIVLVFLTPNEATLLAILTFLALLE